MSETAERTEHFNEASGIATLWFAVLAGPSAWLLGLGTDYALVRIACTEQTMIPLHLVTLATLGLAGAGGVVAWREWRLAGAKRPGEGGGVLSRSRMMSVVGLLASGYFGVVIVAQWAAKLFLHPCMGI